MKRKKHRSRNNTPAQPGPLARKVIAFTKRYMADGSIIPFDALRDSVAQAEEENASIASKEQLDAYDPIHAVYVLCQNQLSVFAEQIAGLPPMRALTEAHVKAEEEYMPAGPPMSPLSKSYFSYWGLCDLSTTGSTRESIASVVIEFLKTFAHPGRSLAAYEAMRDSRMGIYRVAKTSERFVFLEEFVTNRQIKAICPSGYSGMPGEIWYARVLPPPFPEFGFDYSVVTTTPYCLGDMGARGEYTPFTEKQWNDYFARQLRDKDGRIRPEAYERHMKYGRSRNYWNEFIFLAYRNFDPGIIYLQGVPDRPSTLPHSPSYSPFKEG